MPQSHQIIPQAAHSTVHNTDVLIIGAGPVGLFAAFQCGMMGMQCHVVDPLDYVGGQCTALYPEKPIYDIAAHPSISGEDLIANLEKQAAPFNPTYHLSQQVTELTSIENGWEARTSTGNCIQAKAIFIAAGCGAFGPNRPPLNDLEAYEATGAVAYMVQRKEAYRGKKLVIAGGGDSAVDWALSLCDVASHLSVIHRRPKFRCAPDSSKKLQSLADAGKLDLVIPYQLDSLVGENGQLQAVRVKDLDGNNRDVEADVLLPFYGLSMELGPIAQWGLQLDKNIISVEPSSSQTNRSGIYAMGDICHYPGKLKLIACGFSEAAMAAHHAYALVHPDKAYHFEYSTTRGVP